MKIKRHLPNKQRHSSQLGLINHIEVMRFTSLFGLQTAFPFSFIFSFFFQIRPYFIYFYLQMCETDVSLTSFLLKTYFVI
jgi:hypothetical protein